MDIVIGVLLLIVAAGFCNMIFRGGSIFEWVLMTIAMLLSLLAGIGRLANAGACLQDWIGVWLAILAVAAGTAFLSTLRQWRMVQRHERREGPSTRMVRIAFGVAAFAIACAVYQLHTT